MLKYVVLCTITGAEDTGVHDVDGDEKERDDILREQVICLEIFASSPVVNAQIWSKGLGLCHGGGIVLFTWERPFASLRFRVFTKSWIYLFIYQY